MPPVVRTVTWFTIGGDRLRGRHPARRPRRDDAVHRLASSRCWCTSTRRSTCTATCASRTTTRSCRLFTASMLFYVLSSNTLQMLVGWELVGVCSFALIGHWWEEKKNTDAALKAFLTNRVGDVGLIIGVIITFFAAGANSFNVLAHQRVRPVRRRPTSTLLLVGALCLFGGVTSKSGQFPLHTWLPDAMAGPTPVSALIHAATMVVAGVYLIARLYAVFFEGLDIGTSSHQLRGLHRWLHHDHRWRRSPSCRPTSRRCSPTPPSASSATWSWPSASGRGPPASSTSSPTPSSRRASSSAPARSATPATTPSTCGRWAGSEAHAVDLLDLPRSARSRSPGIFPLAGFWSKDEILAGAANGPGSSALHAHAGLRPHHRAA